MSSKVNNKNYRIIFNLLKSTKVLIVSGGLSGMASYLLLTSQSLSDRVEREFNISSLQTGLLLALISIILFTLLYLQSGEAKSNSESIPVNKHIFDELHAKEMRISALEEKLENRSDSSDPQGINFKLTPDERQKILNEIVVNSGQVAINSLFESKAKQFHEDLKKSIIQERLTHTFGSVVDRLQREISDLRLRANVNLVLGIAITGGGLYLLWSTVAMLDSSELLKALASEGSESNAKFLKNLLLPIIPRILLVVFIEVFAYFFLRLYKNGLSEIKYFQNELTNIEAKLISAEFSYLSGNQESLKYALDALSKTERNFILERKQTTVELEKAKSESELTRNIVKSIPSFFQNIKK